MSTYMVIKNNSFMCLDSAPKPYIKLKNNQYLPLTTETRNNDDILLTNSSRTYRIVSVTTTTEQYTDEFIITSSGYSGTINTVISNEIQTEYNGIDIFHIVQKKYYTIRATTTYNTYITSIGSFLFHFNSITINENDIVSNANSAFFSISSNSYIPINYGTVINNNKGTYKFISTSNSYVESGMLGKTSTYKSIIFCNISATTFSTFNGLSNVSSTINNETCNEYFYTEINSTKVATRTITKSE